TRRLRAAGHRVVAVKSSPSPSETGPLMVFGDARDPQVLRAASVARADALYACEPDSPANAAIALAASQVRPATGPPLNAYAYVRDAELCLTLQARYLGAAQPGAVRLDFFNTDELAARKLIAAQELARPDGRAPRVLIVGATTFGRAVLVEIARQWRLLHPHDLGTLPVTLVDRGATVAVIALIQRYPFLRQVCRFTMYDRDLLRVLANGDLHRAPDRVFICHEREEHALKSALSAERFWRGGPLSVVVRLDQLAGIRTAIGAADHGGLFGEASPRLRIFGVIDTACDPGLLGEDLIERLARAIHDRYRMSRLREGDTPLSNPSTVRWEQLAPDRQESNREQARDIGRKLRRVGCALIPRVGPDDPLEPAEVESLAKMERQRWYDWSVSAGWKYGERLDEARKLHPGTHDTWDTVAPYVRQRDREAVREMPHVLADAGFQIVRV
ncbi:MAG TPA: NAD-binding protein, partial [Rugosimonospora sp.]|nr:NAD-binding protein [Rugosimonospora sp.]